MFSIVFRKETTDLEAATALNAFKNTKPTQENEDEESGDEDSSEKDLDGFTVNMDSEEEMSLKDLNKIYTRWKDSIIKRIPRKSGVAYSPTIPKKKGKC